MCSCRPQAQSQNLNSPVDLPSCANSARGSNPFFAVTTANRPRWLEFSMVRCPFKDRLNGERLADLDLAAVDLEQRPMSIFEAHLPSDALSKGRGIFAHSPRSAAHAHSVRTRAHRCYASERHANRNAGATPHLEFTRLTM